MSKFLVDLEVPNQFRIGNAIIIIGLSENNLRSIKRQKLTSIRSIHIFLNHYPTDPELEFMYRFGKLMNSEKFGGIAPEKIKVIFHVPKAYQSMGLVNIMNSDLSGSKNCRVFSDKKFAAFPFGKNDEYQFQVWNTEDALVVKVREMDNAQMPCPITIKFGRFPLDSAGGNE